MRRLTVVLVAACAAMPAGCGRHLLGGGPDRAPDDMFLQFAAMQAHDVIDLSQLAALRGSTEPVRAEARALVADHSAALDRASRLAARRRTSLPTQLDTRHAADLARLSSLQGPEFDREYLRLMVSDQEFILSCYQDRARTSRARAVRSFASQTIPALQHDLEQSRTLANSTLATAP